MDEAMAIILISIVMFLGCFLLGLIPLLIKLSEKRLQFVSIFGAGLLCGTALAIILPEGVELLEESWRDQCTGTSNRTTITATVGLVIHAAADGVVLGVAVVSSKVTVQLVVFLAVILHKAPAAFGLATFLLRAGLEKRQIQKHLLVFSAAAPVLSIITYFILNASGGSAQRRLSATGVGMLFSAGTFLYVATVHVLPEVSSRGQQQSFVNVISGTGTGTGTGQQQSSPHLHGTGTGTEQQQSSPHLHGTGQPQSSPHLHGTGTGQQQSSPHLHRTGTGQQGDLGVLESLTLILGAGLPVLLALGLHDD
uniref:Zinc transporter ZIP9 n=1 Tax=Oncorhynchus tshawytscha TaxID=74940 RepID=A0AAZ3S850_ONCTS